MAPWRSGRPGTAFLAGHTRTISKAAPSFRSRIKGTFSANETRRQDPCFCNTAPPLETHRSESLWFNGLSSWAGGRSRCDSSGRSPRAGPQPPPRFSSVLDRQHPLSRPPNGKPDTAAVLHAAESDSFLANSPFRGQGTVTLYPASRHAGSVLEMRSLGSSRRAVRRRLGAAAPPPPRQKPGGNKHQKEGKWRGVQPSPGSSPKT